MTERIRPAHVLPVPKWTLIIHVVQAVFAVIILGLDAYGIKYIAYKALIFSLVVSLCTLAVCAYLLVSQLFLHKIYNMYVVLAVHAWMLLFWVIDLGLVANLAQTWADPLCGYYGSYGYNCSGYTYTWTYYAKRDTTTTGSYYGALVAGSLFAALEFGTWVATTIITVIFMNRHRTNAINAQAAHPPPQYAAGNNQAVPMEKYNQTGVPQQQQAYQQPYSAAPTPQQSYAQPVQGQFPQQPVAFQQDPVNRTNTVSPVSQAGYMGNASELSSPQHTGNYNPNVSELSTTHNTGHYDPNVSELSTR